MSTTPVNPFRALRERQGLSQYEFARRCRISKHAILRLEQGMYAQALPAVLEYAESCTNLSRHTLEKDYHDFQITTRENNSRLLGDISQELQSTPVGTHPFTYLRENRGLNQTEVAKRLCIAQNTVFYFEKRAVHQHTVPKQLIEALWDADYTEQETYALEEAFLKYRERLVSQQDLRLVTNGG